MKIQTQIKEVGSDITKFLAGLLGVGVGQVVMSFVPRTNIAIADKLLPGAVSLAGAAVVASKFKDAHSKAGAFGMGIAGTANILNKFTEGKTGILAKVNQATALPTPSINGFRGFGNVDATLLGLADTPTSDTPRMLLGESSSVPVWMM